MSVLSPAQRRELKARAHKLHPLVLIGNDGLTQPVLDEIDRALAVHELIKVRAALSGRDGRELLMAGICERARAQPVQVIGKMLVVFRRKPVAPPPPPREQRPPPVRRKRLAGPRKGVSRGGVRGSVKSPRSTKPVRRLRRPLTYRSGRGRQAGSRIENGPEILDYKGPRIPIARMHGGVAMKKAAKRARR